MLANGGPLRPSGGRADFTSRILAGILPGGLVLQRLLDQSIRAMSRLVTA